MLLHNFPKDKTNQKIREMKQNPFGIYAQKLEKIIKKKKKVIDLAQAISWMTDPKRRKVQLKANPAAFQ